MKKWLLWGVPAIAVLGLVGWRFTAEKQAAGELQQQQGARRNMSASVEVATAESRVLTSSIEAVGSAESPFRIEISPKTSGRIEFLQVREGDRVKPGQVLVRIDPSEVQAQVLQQQASVAEARSRLAQAQLGQGPAEVGVASQIQQQRASVFSAEADLNQVRNNYSSQVASAEAGVTDAQSKLQAAQSQEKNAQAEVSRQQANLRNAQTRLTRIEGLYKQGFIAAQEVDDARTAVEVQQGSLDVAEGQLAASRSGISGAQAQVRSAQEQLAIVKRKGQADIAAAQARVTQAKAGLNVASANRAQSPAYRQNLAALRASVEAAEAQLSQARARLGETSLKSTIEGIVTSRSADPGALATPGQPILVVQFLDWLYVTSSLPIERSGDVREGQLAEIRFDALPDRVFRGRVTNINPAADVQSRQFGLRVRVENRDRSLKPGMYGRIALVRGQVDAEVVVPKEAVKIDDSGKATVTLVDDEMTAHVREVKLGASDGRGYQILEGVNKGDKVVTLSYQPVRDGAKVRLPGEGGEGSRGGQGQGGGGKEKAKGGAR